LRLGVAPASRRLIFFAVAVAVAVAFRCHPEPIRAPREWVRDLLLLLRVGLSVSRGAELHLRQYARASRQAGRTITSRGTQ
jgi:hypothetical protein